MLCVFWKAEIAFVVTCLSSPFHPLYSIVEEGVGGIHSFSLVVVGVGLFLDAS